MSYSPVPRFSFRDVTDISPGFLNMNGIRFLMVDLDNTIASYDEHAPTGPIIRWTEEIKASGVKLLIVSNSRREGRVEAFAQALGIGFIKSARKPSPHGVLHAMLSEGYTTDESALLGDQIYTDALAANRAGVISIAVRPRSIRNPLLAARYALESPFRAAARKQSQRLRQQ